MTHAQYFRFHQHLHTIQIRNCLAWAVAILSGLCRFSKEIDVKATALLTNKAAAMSIELFALEQLEANAPLHCVTKPRSETLIERLILNCWQPPHHIKITPYVCLDDESKDGLTIRFYNSSSKLIDVLNCSEPGADTMGDKLLALCQWCSAEIKSSDGGLFEIEGETVCNDCGYAYFDSNEEEAA